MIYILDLPIYKTFYWIRGVQGWGHITLEPLYLHQIRKLERKTDLQSEISYYF